MKHGEKITIEFDKYLSCRECCFAKNTVETPNGYDVECCLVDTEFDNETGRCWCGGFAIKSESTGPHLTTRFGDDPDVLQKIQHIRDYYNGDEVPEYEFFAEVGNGLGGRTGTLIGIDADGSCHDEIGVLWENCHIKQPAPTFNTRLGQLTDDDARKGNPKGGRVWVMDDNSMSTRPLSLVCVTQTGCFVHNDDGDVWRTDTEDCRLATKEELQLCGIDPEEAGIKGETT